MNEPRIKIEAKEWDIGDNLVQVFRYQDGSRGLAIERPDAEADLCDIPPGVAAEIAAALGPERATPCEREHKPFHGYRCWNTTDDAVQWCSGCRAFLTLLGRGHERGRPAGNSPATQTTVTHLPAYGGEPSTLPPTWSPLAAGDGIREGDTLRNIGDCQETRIESPEMAQWWNSSHEKKPLAGTEILR